MLPFEATYYDGKTSEPHTVLVHVTEGGALHLVGAALDLRFEQADVRLAPRLGNASRSIALPDDQKLETTDNDAVDRLASLRRTGAGAAWVNRLESSWPLACAALAGVLLVVGASAVWGIPLGARLVALALPDHLAHRVGTDTLTVLDKTLFEPSDADADARARIADRFDQLAAFHPDLPLRLELRRMGVPNAFALPDGTVVVTDELLELAENDDELAAVVAHEIGHVRHRHGLRMVLESSSVALLVSTYLGDAAQISTVLAALPAAYSQAGYSRSHEAEADEFAFEMMQTASIAPHHFANILRRLQDVVGGEDDGALQYLSSHPPTAARVERFEPPESM